MRLCSRDMNSVHDIFYDLKEKLQFDISRFQLRLKSAGFWVSSCEAWCLDFYSVSVNGFGSCARPI